MVVVKLLLRHSDRLSFDVSFFWAYLPHSSGLTLRLGVPAFVFAEPPFAVAPLVVLGIGHDLLGGPRLGNGAVVEAQFPHLAAVIVGLASQVGIIDDH
jgi:hypothetical protein